jgi:hypothetical protein
MHAAALASKPAAQAPGHQNAGRDSVVEAIAFTSPRGRVAGSLIGPVVENSRDRAFEEIRMQPALPAARSAFRTSGAPASGPGSGAIRNV